MDIIALVTGSMAIIGFLSVWIKLGVEKGVQKKAMEQLEHKTSKHEKEIAELKNTTHSIQLDIAKSMGKIEAKLDSIGKLEVKIGSISEKVAALKGGRRATEKQD
jgi:chromosome segregation ATPase